MKKQIKRVFFSLLVFPLIIMQANAAVKTYTLKIADSYPPSHPTRKVAEHFMKTASELSNGRLKFKYYPAQQLGKLPDMLKICQQGLADITYIGVSYLSGQFPMNTVVELPYWNTANEGTSIYIEMLKHSSELSKEWEKNGVFPLAVATTSQYEVVTKNQSLQKVDDLQGLRLHSSGWLFEMIAKRYGIVPITLSINETYEALQRDILDGTISTYPTVKGYRLNDITNHYTCGLQMGGFIGAYAINKRVYQRLPTDLQKVLLQAGRKSSMNFTVMWDKLDSILLKSFTKAGGKVYQIDADKKTEWLAPLKGIEEEWITKHEKKGAPARKVFEQFKDIAQKITRK